MNTYVKIFVVGTVGAILLRLLVFENFRILSNSMLPNLMPGDIVFVLKPAYALHLPFSSYEIARFRPPRRFEVVAFSLPEVGGETYVKRIVALGGEKVGIEKGVLNVTQVRAGYEQKSIDTSTANDSYVERWGGHEHRLQWVKNKIQDFGPIEVPSDHFFALGDNRADSKDSRHWGPIPYSCIKGKVELILASVNERGKLRKERLGAILR